MPYGGSTILRPAQHHTVCLRFVSRKGGRCHTRYGGGEGHDVAPYTLCATVALPLHPHVILGFRDKTGYGGFCCVRIKGLPSAGGNLIAYNHIINIEVVLVIRGKLPADILGASRNVCTIEMPLLVGNGDFPSKAEACYLIGCGAGANHKGLCIGVV